MNFDLYNESAAISILRITNIVLKKFISSADDVSTVCDGGSHLCAMNGTGTSRVIASLLVVNALAAAGMDPLSTFPVRRHAWSAMSCNAQFSLRDANTNPASAPDEQTLAMANASSQGATTETKLQEKGQAQGPQDPHQDPHRGSKRKTGLFEGWSSHLVASGY